MVSRRLASSSITNTVCITDLYQGTAIGARMDGSEACFTTLLQVGDVIFFPRRIYLYVPIEKSVCGIYRNLLAGIRRMRERGAGGGIPGIGDWLCRGRTGVRADGSDHGVCD